MLLLIDNYDSFVHNLARHFRRLGQETVVVRNDAIDWRGVKAMKPDGIVISPGPCTPVEAGCSVDVVRKLVDDIPILGVCLGHQAIAAGARGEDRPRGNRCMAESAKCATMVRVCFLVFHRHFPYAVIIRWWSTKKVWEMICL